MREKLLDVSAISCGLFMFFTATSGLFAYAQSSATGVFLILAMLGLISALISGFAAHFIKKKTKE